MSGVCTNLRLKAMQRQIDSASPGPSAHVPLLGLVQPKSPSVRIGTAPRSPTGASSSPGPADYQDPRWSTVVGAHVENSRLRAIPQAVIGTSSRGSPTGRAQGGGEGPGPASYAPSLYAAPRSPALAFGRDRRSHGSGEGAEVPGPGAHTVSLGFTQEASPRQPMGTAARFGGSVDAGAPGPGAYAAHLVDGITGKSVSSARPQSARALIGTAQRPSLGGGSPSPGPAYSPSTRHTLPTSPGFSVGRAPRDGGAAAALRAQEASPGPGRYAAEAHDAATRPSSPRQPMGSAPRFGSSGGGEEEAVVGPGAYNIDQRGRVSGGAIGSAPRPSLGGSPARLGEGPGVAYAHTAASAAVRPRSASAVFGQSPRFGGGGGGGSGLQDSPSAASYRVSLAATQPSPSRTLIGRAARGGGWGGGEEGSPGPGAYAVERMDALGALSSSSTRRNAPRQRIGSAQRSSSGSGSGSTSPGPAYSPNTAFVLPRSAGFAMPRSPRDAVWRGGEAGPGPADYGLADGGGVVLPSSPQVRIGTAARFPGESDRDAPLPGPGAYVVQGHNYITGGTLTRAQRPALSPSAGGPGPGAYGSGLGSLNSSHGLASFPRDPRFHEQRDGEGAPGPGAHDTVAGFSYLLPQSPRSIMGRAARAGGSGGADAAMAHVPLYSTSGALAVTRPSSPRQPIGSAPRFSPGRGEDTPGPGAFLGNADTRRGPAFTIRGER